VGIGLPRRAEELRLRSASISPHLLSAWTAELIARGWAGPVEAFAVGEAADQHGDQHQSEVSEPLYLERLEDQHPGKKYRGSQHQRCKEAKHALDRSPISAAAGIRIER
jgi:hypothetical protein